MGGEHCDSGLGDSANPVFGFAWDKARSWTTLSAEEIAVIGVCAAAGIAMHLLAGIAAGGIALLALHNLRTKDHNRADHLALRLRALERRGGYRMLDKDKKWRPYR